MQFLSSALTWWIGEECTRVVSNLLWVSAEEFGNLAQLGKVDLGWVLHDGLRDFTHILEPTL